MHLCVGEFWYFQVGSGHIRKKKESSESQIPTSNVAKGGRTGLQYEEVRKPSVILLPNGREYRLRAFKLNSARYVAFKYVVFIGAVIVYMWERLD